MLAEVIVYMFIARDADEYEETFNYKEKTLVVTFSKYCVFITVLVLKLRNATKCTSITKYN